MKTHIVHQNFTQVETELTTWLESRFVTTSPDVKITSFWNCTKEKVWFHQLRETTAVGEDTHVNVMYAKPNSEMLDIGLTDETHNLSDDRMFRLVEYKPNLFFVFVEPKSNFYLLQVGDSVNVESQSSSVDSVTELEIIIRDSNLITKKRFSRETGKGIETSLAISDNPYYVKVKRVVDLLSVDFIPSGRTPSLYGLMDAIERRV